MIVIVEIAGIILVVGLVFMFIKFAIGALK